jgi:hypothetical protein
MQSKWEHSNIFFASMLILLTFLPPLIYNYSKNLLDKALNAFKNKTKDSIKKRDIVIKYYFMVDQIVYIWVIYILFCLFCALFKLLSTGEINFFNKILLAWLIYTVLIIIISIVTFFWDARLIKWGKKEGRIWICIVAIYAYGPITFLLSLKGMFKLKLESNFNNTSLWMIAIALGFYILWWIASIWTKPMQAFIDLKEN